MLLFFLTLSFVFVFRALLALINTVKPGIITGADSTNPAQQLNNCTLATQLADVHLKIPKIIDAETLASGQMDELSMITYLSYFVEPAEAKLKKWVKRAIPQAAANFTTSWYDGLLLCVLLNKCFPGAMPQVAKMTRENARSNVQEFFETCKKKLNFEPHFSVEDLIAGRIEELQVMTAILQVQNGQLQSMPETVTVGGNGLEVAKIGKENTFRINTTEAGPGKLNVDAYYEDGRKLKFKLKEKVGGVLTFSYTPPTQGRLVFDVRWSDIPIPSSPFFVLAMNPSMIHILDFDQHNTVREVGTEVNLKLEMKQATKLSGLSAHLSYRKGIKVEASVIESEGSTAILRFTPPHAGNAILQVFLNKRELNHLSVSYTVVDSGGYQIESLPQSSSYETFEEVEFVVNSTKNLPLDVLKMTAILTDDIQFPLSFKSVERSCGHVSFKPTLPGKYKIAVTCAGSAVQGIPFYIQVTAPLSCKLIGVLPTYLVVDKPYTFELETNVADTELVKLDCMGADPSSAFQVYCIKGDKDVVLLTVTPRSEGVFMTGIKFQNQWVQGFPFQLTVCNPLKYRITGELLRKKSMVVGETINFRVESAQEDIAEGQLLPVVTAKGPTAKYSPKYHTKEDGRALLFQFTPYEIGAHEIAVTYGGFQVPSSPVLVNVVAYNSHTFSATGSGLQEAYTNITGQFIILTKKTGLAKNGILQVKIAGVINGKECGVNIRDNENGSYNVSYFITNPGAYLITILAGRTHIPGSPFKLTALPGPNPLKCKMLGPALNESEIFTIGQSIDFTVDATKGGVGKLVVKATRTDGVSARVFVAKDSSSKGVHYIKIDPTHHGKYEVSVKWSGTDVPGSPFAINVFPGVDATKCKAYGPGLENSRVGTLTEFYIETHNAGPGNLGVDIHGVQDMCKIDIKPKDIKDVRTMVARYFPRKPGTFIISVTWSEKHIPGSPFKVKITGEAMDDAFKPNKFKPPVRNDELESIAEAEDEEDNITDIDFDVSSLASRPRHSQVVVRKVPSVKSLDEVAMPSFQRSGHRGFQETFVNTHTDSMMSKSLTHIAKDTKSTGKQVKKKKRKKAAAVKANGPKTGSLK